MANRRMLDAAFWSDKAVQKLSRLARYLFIGLIAHADDEGRVDADPAYLRSRIFLYDDDVTSEDVDSALGEIARACDSVCLYESGREQYIAFLKWEQYQSIRHSRGSRFPPPPAEPSPTTSKPGPKRKLRPPEQSGDNSEPIQRLFNANSSPIQSPIDANSRGENRQGIDDELALTRARGSRSRNRSRREEKTKERAAVEAVHARPPAHARVTTGSGAAGVPGPPPPPPPPPRTEPEASDHPLFEASFAAASLACYDVADPRTLGVDVQFELRRSVGACLRAGIEPADIQAVVATWTRATPPYPSQLCREALRARAAQKMKPKGETDNGRREPKTFGELRSERNARNRAAFQQSIEDTLAGRDRPAAPGGVEGDHSQKLLGGANGRAGRGGSRRAGGGVDGIAGADTDRSSH